MTDHDELKNRHFILGGFTETERFIRPRLKIEQKQVPERDRRRHGTALLGQVEVLKPEMAAAREAQKAAGLDGGFGLRVEFESFPGIELAFESLARERSGIELLNARYENHRTYATIFVPDGKLGHFESLIRDYLEEKRDRAGRARDHKILINAIQRQPKDVQISVIFTDLYI